MIRLRKWRIQVNNAKFAHVTFTNLKDTFQPVKLASSFHNAKYFGMYLDRKLTWKNVNNSDLTQAALIINWPQLIDVFVPTK